ncbi:MAG: cytidine deaminase [Deltaproteobacteria bacterium]|nr:MAG: cytidine deaminase [Deltaproteobacteria bacterium]
MRKSEYKLVEAALEVRLRAYAPYSGFKVGAAILTDTGEIFTGCNVENASYGATICAERNAVAAAVAAGARGFVRLAIATGSSPPSPPCGLCRQVLGEFNPRLGLLLVNHRGQLIRTTLTRLLPSPFRSIPE